MQSIECNCTDHNKSVKQNRMLKFCEFQAQPQMQSSYGGGSRPNPELRTLSTFTSHQNNTFTNPSGAEVSYNFNQTNTILAGSTGNASYNSNAKSNTPGGGGYSSRDAFGAIGPGFSSANVGDNHIYSTIDEDQKQAQLSRLRLEFEGSMDTKNPNAGSKSAGTKNYQPIFAFNEWKDMQPTNSPQSLPSVGESPQLPLPMSALGSDSVALRRLQETSQQNRVTSNNNMLRKSAVWNLYWQNNIHAKCLVALEQRLKQLW